MRRLTVYVWSIDLAVDCNVNIGVSSSKSLPIVDKPGPPPNALITLISCKPYDSSATVGYRGRGWQAWGHYFGDARTWTTEAEVDVRTPYSGADQVPPGSQTDDVTDNIICACPEFLI